MNEWINEIMNEWMNERINEWRNKYLWMMFPNICKKLMNEPAHKRPEDEKILSEKNNYENNNINAIIKTNNNIYGTMTNSWKTNSWKTNSWKTNSGKTNRGKTNSWRDKLLKIKTSEIQTPKYQIKKKMFHNLYLI